MLERSCSSSSRAPTPKSLHRSIARGMTLIEVVVVLAILAILLAIAVPSFSAILEKQRVDAVVYRLVAHLQTARTTAITRNVRTTLAPIDGDHWESGWQVFTDANRSAAFDAGDELIARAPAIEPGTSIRGSASGQSWVSFTADGRPRLLDGGFQAGTFTICAGADRGTQVIMSRSGRIRLQPAGTACRALA